MSAPTIEELLANPAASPPVTTDQRRWLLGLLDLKAADAARVPAPTRFSNMGANATLNVKATPGSVLAFVCANLNAAVRYLQLHDTATVPAGAAVPAYSFPIAANGSIVIGADFFTTAGVAFATGIAFAFSTTAGTYTAGVATDQVTTIHFA